MAYVYSMYIHLKQWSVQVTETSHVNAGDWIAEVDRTGEGAGPQDHLHLQIVVHPQLDRTLDPFTLDSENRSRNPELWLSPYNGNTGTVVGKVTDVNGNPVSGLHVNGLLKQAGWGYGWSETYPNANWVNPDDILVENWATTDVTPGRYHITLSNGSDMGWHDVQAGRTTYVGLYPVWLPEVRNNYGSNWVSTIIVRNDSSTYRAQVNTTFFNKDGSVRHQRTDYVNVRAVASLDVPANWEGSAMVVSSEDVAVMVRNQSGDELAEYNGTTASAGSPGWERTGTTLYVPVIKYAWAGRSSRLLLANAGSTATTAYVEFYNAGGGVVGNASVNLAPNGSDRISPDNYCPNPPSQCSARIWSSNGQPLAVAVLERTDSDQTNRTMHNAFSAGATTNFAPGVKKNYAGQSSYVTVQNLGAQATSVHLTCFSTGGATYDCGTVPVPSMATAVFSVGGVASLPDGFYGSAVVSTNPARPVAALIYETGNPYKLCTNADLSGSVTAYAPEIYGNYQTWNSGISIQNVGSGVATITVRYYDSLGNPVGQPVASPAICPNCSWMVNYWAGNLPGNFYGSAVIQATQPIAAIVNTSHSGSGDTKASYTVPNR